MRLKNIRCDNFSNCSDTFTLLYFVYFIVIPRCNSVRLFTSRRLAHFFCREIHPLSPVYAAWCPRPACSVRSRPGIGRRRRQVSSTRHNQHSARTSEAAATPANM